MAAQQSAGIGPTDGASGDEGAATPPSDNPWAAPPPGAPPFDRSALPPPPTYAGPLHGPPPVYGSPPGPPPQLGPSAPRTERSQRGVIALWAGASSMLSVLLFPNPVGIALGVAAVVLGILARRNARATGIAAPGAVLAIVTGLCGTVLTGVPLALIYPDYSEHRHCVARANTDIAHDICDEAYRAALKHSFGS